MHAQQQSPLSGVVQSGEVLHDVDEIAVALVVGPTDARVPVVIAELEQQRGQVVRELTVVDGRGAQRVSHGDVGEQGRRRDGERAHGQQRLEQTGLVEQRVGALLEQHLLVAGAPPRVAPRQRERDQPEVLYPQATADVGQDHAQASL